MISQEYIDALKKINEKLKNSGIWWAVIGKTNLALHGINLTPSHLGIIFKNKDLHKFLELFSEYKSSHIELLPNKEAEEFYLFLGNVEVLVCAEHSYGTYFTIKQDIEEIKIDDFSINVYSLKSELSAYRNLGLDEPARVIEDFLESAKK